MFRVHISVSVMGWGFSKEKGKWWSSKENIGMIPFWNEWYTDSCGRKQSLILYSQCPNVLGDEAYEPEINPPVFIKLKRGTPESTSHIF